MTEPNRTVGPDQTSTPPELFAPRAKEPRERSTMLMTWAVAGAVVLLAVAGLLLGSRHKATPSASTIQPLDPYAPNLVFTDLQMSESSALSAVKVMYIDGHIRNTGSRTISRATAQVLFGNDVQLPPQIETLPVTLVRTREPYVDTEPLSSDPLKPGQEREFRLIFENIGANWNQQLPQVRVVGVE